MRQRVVGLALELGEVGKSLRWVAKRLAIGATTLRDWIARALAGELVPRVLGRPRSVSKLLRRMMLEYFWENPRCGPRRLTRAFKRLSRDVLSDWKDRVVSRLARRRVRELTQCRWPVVGAVWAMDHTHLAARLVDRTRETLVVRDMASGMLLTTSPARLHDGREVAAELALLFMEHGAPLAIKCDNGSMLICQHVRAVCEAWGVVLLRSPVRCPSFNGGCERSLGWWKQAVEPWARDGVLSDADLEEARRLVNELPRERGPCAQSVWSQRRCISSEERSRFLATYDEEVAAREAAIDLPSDMLAPNAAIGATIHRSAAIAALYKLDYLRTRR